MSWTSLCKFSELQEGLARHIDIGGLQLAVYLHAGRVYVMDNHCPHAGGSMSAGHVADGCAVCPWHGWAFRLDTGQLREYPAITIPVYPTRLLDRDGFPTLVQANLPP